jgi:hypothetical protein
VNGSAVEAAGLVVALLNLDVEPVLEDRPVSRDYGQMSDAVAACWRIEGRVSGLRWKISFRQDVQD